ncbi:MAG: HIRAN domain-containing protein [Vulcanimicrobiota bacterium]
MDKPLLLIWKHPISRVRYAIGKLWQDEQGYHFSYEFDMPCSVEHAIRDGFRPLDPFPLKRGAWSSGSLFPVFSRRLPPTWRQGEFQKLGLEPEQKLQYLLKTGGRLTGDTFEFLEPMDVAQSEFEIEFPIAGWRYHEGESAIHELTPGTSLTLLLEKDNPHDSSAIKIMSPACVHLGYVPRIYAWHIDRSIDHGDYEAKISRVGPSEDPQVRVIVKLKGHIAPSGYRPIPEGLAALC